MQEAQVLKEKSAEFLPLILPAISNNQSSLLYDNDHCEHYYENLYIAPMSHSVAYMI